MTGPAYSAGRAGLALVLALAVTGVASAILIPVTLVADDVANGRSVFAGEVFSTFLYFLIFGTMLTLVFGFAPFAAVGFLLWRLRTTSAMAFAVGGVVAGAAGVLIFLLTTSKDTDSAMEQLANFVSASDLTGAAILFAAAIGGLAARHYLTRGAAPDPAA